MAVPELEDSPFSYIPCSLTWASASEFGVKQVGTRHLLRGDRSDVEKVKVVQTEGLSQCKQ